MHGELGEPDELAHRDDPDEEFTPRRRAWIRPVAWVAVVALVLGAGFSSALAFLAGGGAGGAPDREAAVVSAPVEERGTGSGTVAIQAPPEGATGLVVRFTCLSAGDFSWGIDPADHRTSSCTDGDIGSDAWTEFELPDAPQLYIEADRDARWSVWVVYVSRDQAERV